MVKKIRWSDAIFFFDIDDTLIETGKNSAIASEGIFNALKQKIGEGNASRLTERFNHIFLTLANQHWSNEEDDHKEYDEIIEKIKVLQEPVIKKYGNIRKWSREVFLKIAGDDLNIPLSSRQIHKAVDGYWNMVSEKSIPINGVVDFFKEIKTHNRPIYLVTGSDARLIMNDKGLFEYDPVYSEKFKAKRINQLKNKGLFFNKFSIGDPEDKPHLDFFEKAMKIAEDDLGYEIDRSNSLMFGDSYAADLQVPREKMGFGLVVLIKKNQKRSIEEGMGYISTGDISLTVDYLTL